MIIKSRVTGQMVLDIFENFRTDQNLPKFKKPEEKNENTGQYVTITSGSTISSSATTTIFSTGNNFIVSDPMWSEGSSGNTGSVGGSEPKKKKSLLELFTGLFKRKKNVVKVFDQVFESLEQVKEFKEREDHIDAALASAEKNGQTALVEKIKGFRLVHRLESQLLALNFIKVIDERQLVNFAYDSERGLRLDWIRNFTRSIPAGVIEKKDKADALKLFDNYVILHYDPDNHSNQLTREEVEKKKDPILFGVFKESRKLYYVGDWIDEHCNLTFDVLITKIGEENLKIKKEVV